MKKNAVKRFEIYLYDFGETTGSIQSGKRPVLVIQDDRFNAHSPTTVVATITSAIKKQYLPSHVVLGEQFGLTKPSMVMVEQSRTVNQEDLGAYIGTITDDSLKRTLAKAIKKTFGLWSYEPKDTSSVRCLCPHCMESYKSSGKYIVRRLDPFQREKEKCDRCERMGWDYIIAERKKNS